MNKISRILIIGVNFAFIPIMLPIQLIRGTMKYIRDREEYIYYDITYKEFVGWMFKGFIEGLKTNIEFWKTGDIHVFDWMLNNQDWEA